MTRSELIIALLTVSILSGILGWSCRIKFDNKTHLKKHKITDDRAPIKEIPQVPINLNDKAMVNKAGIVADKKWYSIIVNIDYDDSEYSKGINSSEFKSLDKCISASDFINKISRDQISFCTQGKILTGYKSYNEEFIQVIVPESKKKELIKGVFDQEIIDKVYGVTKGKK